MVEWSELERLIGLAQAEGAIGMTVLGPGDARWRHNGSRGFRAASTVKMPLLVTLYHSIEQGDMSLSDTVALSAADKTPGSGVLSHLHDELVVSIADLLYLMISISDNTATNLLLRRVGLARAQATLRELGMYGSTFVREMRGRAALPGEPENVATPDDYAMLMHAILAGEVASMQSCAAMRGLLEEQQNSRRIARFLPPNGERGVRWGSKTGSLHGAVNDVGFVSGPGGTLALAIFCEGFDDPHSAEAWIGQLSRAALRATGVVTQFVND